MVVDKGDDDSGCGVNGGEAGGGGWRCEWPRVVMAAGSEGGRERVFLGLCMSEK